MKVNGPKTTKALERTSRPLGLPDTSFNYEMSDEKGD